MTAAEPQPSPEPTPAPEPTPEPTASWRDSLESADLKANPTLERFGSLDDFARSHLELRSTLGSDKIAIPGKDAKPEEWDAVFAKLGRPDTAEGYDLGDWQPPEGVPWNPEVTTAMLGKMHARRLTKDMAQGVLNDYGEMQQEIWNAHVAEVQQQVEDTKKALQTKWGAAYNPKMEGGKRAALAFIEKAGLSENPFDQELPDGRLVGDLPGMIELLAAMGEEFGEDEGAGPVRGRLTQTPEEAQRKLDQLLADPEKMKALTDAMHPLHKEIQDYKTSLEREIHA
jgi:hypothetical protein